MAKMRLLVLALLLCTGMAACAGRDRLPDSSSPSVGQAVSGAGSAGTVPDDPPVKGMEPELSADGFDAAYTVDVKITVKDAGGNPVPNLCVNLQYVSGEEGSYMPGDALTKSNGTVVREAHPAEYLVLISDRKQLDYEGRTLRGQQSFPITVTDGENSFTFTWEGGLPLELDSKTDGKVTFLFEDKAGNPVQDLWVNFSDKVDDNPFDAAQIVLGHTGADGKVYWTMPESGSYNMGVFQFTGDKEEHSIVQSYTFELPAPPDGAELSFTWNPSI